MVDISFHLSQTIQELKQMVAKKLEEKGDPLERPVDEYQLTMTEPFHYMRPTDCAGAYVDLVAKSASPLSFYFALDKDTLYCPVAQKVFYFFFLFFD